MKQFLFILFLLFPGLVQAQPKADTFKCFFEPMPQFPGGQDSLFNYLRKNLVYPQTFIEDDVEGRVVVRFLVRTDGSVDSFSVLRGLNSALDSEVLRVLKTMPNWIPDKNQKQSIWWTMPISIKRE